MINDYRENHFEKGEWFNLGQVLYGLTSSYLYCFDTKLSVLIKNY